MKRWDDGLRPYTPADREQAHLVLRRLLLAGDVPFTVHPGDWDWWAGHEDPRSSATLRLVGEAAVVQLGSDGELTSMGLPRTRWAIMPDAVRSVGWVSSRDDEAREVLGRAGLRPSGRAMALFERDVPDATEAACRVPALVPSGYVVRPLAGADEADSRADAARLAFGSTLEPQQHRSRYRGFMTSPGYQRARDLVAVVCDGPGQGAGEGEGEGDGDVAAFAVVWPDVETSLGLIEPVGTHPAHRRRGLARAVIGASLLDLATLGISRVRVCSWAHTPAPLSLYLACGFAQVDTLTWWGR